MIFQYTGKNLRADETTTKVAREGRLIALVSFDGAALAQAWASSNVFIIRDSIERVLPIPISSARMPPPVSEC
jgi:hypothetical protein